VFIFHDLGGNLNDRNPPISIALCIPYLLRLRIMIFLFILYSLFLRGDVLAGPLSSQLQPSLEIYPRNRFIQRSEWNIVWSCFATLFACSWVAIHPNIPLQSDSSMRRLARRLMIMGYMLIAPEFVIWWAARQWLAARDIAKKCEGVLSISQSTGWLDN
jgi:hypothetical protein